MNVFFLFSFVRAFLLLLILFSGHHSNAQDMNEAFLPGSPSLSSDSSFYSTFLNTIHGFTDEGSKEVSEKVSEDVRQDNDLLFARPGSCSEPQSTGAAEEYIFPSNTGPSSHPILEGPGHEPLSPLEEHEKASEGIFSGPDIEKAKASGFWSEVIDREEPEYFPEEYSPEITDKSSETSSELTETEESDLIELEPDETDIEQELAEFEKKEKAARPIKFSKEERESLHFLLTEFSDNPRYRDPAGARYLLGQIHEMKGQFEEAMAHYEKVIELYPHSPFEVDSRTGIARCLTGLKKYDKAIARYRELIKREKLPAELREELLFEIGQIYSRELTGLSGVLEAYKQVALRYDYSQGNSIAFLAGYFKGYHLLDAHNAIETFLELTEKFKQRKRHYQALFNIGLIYAWDLSETKTALKYFDKVISFSKDVELKRQAALLTGLLKQFHETPPDGDMAVEYYRSVIASSSSIDIYSTIALYFTGYHYTKNSREITVTPELADRIMSVYQDKKAFELLSDFDEDPIIHGLAALYIAFAYGQGDFWPAEAGYALASTHKLLLNDITGHDQILDALVRQYPGSLRASILGRKKDYRPVTDNLGAKIAMEKALQYFEEEKFDLAIKEFYRVVEGLKKGELAESAMHRIARIYEEDLKDYPKAIEKYYEFLVRFPLSTSCEKIKYSIARIHELYLLDFHEAARIYRELLEEGKDETWIYLSGKALIEILENQLKEPKEKARILEKLLARCPGREATILYEIAEEHWKSKDFKKALEYYEKIAANYPLSPHFDRALDRLMQAGAREELASMEKTLEKLDEMSREEQLATLTLKFEKEKLIEDYEAAMKTLEKLKSISGTEEEAAEWELEIAKLEVLKLNKVEEGLKRLAILAMKFPSTNIAYQALLATGRAYETELKDYKKADLVYDLIIRRLKKSPTRMWALYYRALLAAQKLKDPEKAMNSYYTLLVDFFEDAKREGLDTSLVTLLDIPEHLRMPPVGFSPEPPQLTASETEEIALVIPPVSPGDIARPLTSGAPLGTGRGLYASYGSTEIQIRRRQYSGGIRTPGVFTARPGIPGVPDQTGNTIPSSKKRRPDFSEPAASPVGSWKGKTPQERKKLAMDIRQKLGRERNAVFGTLEIDISPTGKVNLIEEEVITGDSLNDSGETDMSAPQKEVQAVQLPASKTPPEKRKETDGFWLDLSPSSSEPFADESSLITESPSSDKESLSPSDRVGGFWCGPAVEHTVGEDNTRFKNISGFWTEETREQSTSPYDETGPADRNSPEGGFWSGQTGGGKR